MIEELRKVKLELDLNPADIDLIERCVVLSKRLGRNDILKRFPVCIFEIIRYFSKNKSLMKKYIKIQNKYNFGDPPWIAYCMILHQELDKKWAEKFIENSKTGSPSWAAYFMFWHHGSDRSWAEKVIENDKSSDCSEAAYCLVRYCGADRSWAEKVIENAKIGNPAYFAELMVEYCGSSQEWADKVKESWESRND